MYSVGDAKRLRREIRDELLSEGVPETFNRVDVELVAKTLDTYDRLYFNEELSSLIYGAKALARDDVAGMSIKVEKVPVGTVNVSEGRIRGKKIYNLEVSPGAANSVDELQIVVERLIAILIFVSLRDRPVKDSEMVVNCLERELFVVRTDKGMSDRIQRFRPGELVEIFYTDREHTDLAIVLELVDDTVVLGTLRGHFVVDANRIDHPTRKWHSNQVNFLKDTFDEYQKFKG